MVETTEPAKEETNMRKMLCVISLFLAVSTAEAAYLDLAWDPNQEPDLAGYRIYYGICPGEYLNFVDVGLTTTYRLDDLLEETTFYVTLTAYDEAGNESDFSAEVCGFGVLDDYPVDEPDYGIGGEPTETDSPIDQSKRSQKSNSGSERGRKLGRKK
jgi:hypothetical protein